MNLYLNGIIAQQGFYLIKPLLRHGFLNSIGYLRYEHGRIFLKRSVLGDLEITPDCPWLF